MWFCLQMETLFFLSGHPTPDRSFSFRHILFCVLLQPTNHRRHFLTYFIMRGSNRSFLELETRIGDLRDGNRPGDVEGRHDRISLLSEVASPHRVLKLLSHVVSPQKPDMATKSSTYVGIRKNEKHAMFYVFHRCVNSLITPVRPSSTRQLLRSVVVTLSSQLWSV